MASSTKAKKQVRFLQMDDGGKFTKCGYVKTTEGSWSSE